MVERLLALMEALRDPEGGCPWDRAQDFASIAPYTLEEAYEVDDAIRRGDFEGLRDELGDLLLQVVYHAQLAREERRFDFADVVEAICAKLVRRHPHVFGTAPAPDAEGRGRAWEAHKAAERAHRGQVGALAGVPAALPALARAAKLQGRAARVGFAFASPAEALDQLEEEARELAHEVRGRGSAARAQAELGDLLFAAAALARGLGLDPETALRDANARFERRFRAMETRLAGRAPDALDRDEWLALWREVRAAEEAPC